MTTNLNQLAIAYRPQKFEDVVGHDLSVLALKGMVESKDLPTGILLSGYPGAGKTTLARIVANELKADVIEVDAASHGGVAEVRKLTEGLKYASGSDYSVLIIDEAHSLTRDAFNALLKSLEEPPPNTLFILVTTDPQHLPMTVRTRMVEFNLEPLTPVEILKRMLVVVKAEDIHTTAELVKYIAMNSEGSVRQALTSLGLCASTNITEVDDYLKIVGKENVTVTLIEHMLNQNLAEMYLLAESALTKVSSPQVIISQFVTTLKELMVINSGVVKNINVDLERKEMISKRLHKERIFAMMRMLWDLRVVIKTKGDPRTDLELALALMYDLVNKGVSEKVKPVIHSKNKIEDVEELTLDDIEEIVG